MTLISEKMECVSEDVEIEMGNLMPGICDVCHESVTIGISIVAEDGSNYNYSMTNVIICKPCLNKITGIINNMVL